jgi:excisionase family DNA binding protein
MPVDSSAAGPEPSRLEPLWGVAQTAEYLHVSVDTLYRWHGHGEGPPCYRVSRKLRYIREEVEAWVRAGRACPEEDP